MEGNPLTLIPVLVFLLVTFAVVMRINRRVAVEGKSFVPEYFIGSRSLGGFVLAMTTIATYGSVSSFVGGPGQAWSVGWGWVYMSAVQVTALFLLFGHPRQEAGPHQPQDRGHHHHRRAARTLQVGCHR